MGSLLFRLLLLTLAVIVASAPLKKGHRRHNAVDQFPKSSMDRFPIDKGFNRPLPEEWKKRQKILRERMIEEERQREHYYSRPLDRPGKVKQNHARG
ncbi:hypothetical protein ANCCAN_28792 [Ancylostoma caninum]|uniref:Uncharacterized protein n=1 Tax=Ancylostoma caninum TaxID=29170 RepID=A0A368F3K7_ANCCA|nr:hypothetical protein ANCCAN_28792 [Ancylostoma caninum]